MCPDKSEALLEVLHIYKSNIMPLELKTFIIKKKISGISFRSFNIKTKISGNSVENTFIFSITLNIPRRQQETRTNKIIEFFTSCLLLHLIIP